MMTVFIYILLLSIFYLGVYIGKKLYTNNNKVAQLGKSIYIKKNEQLANSPLFKPIRTGIKQGSFIRIFWLIVSLILLKSVGFYFVSILLITPLLLLFQGISIGSLFSYYKQTEGSLGKLTNITFWQLVSHCAAGTYGIVVGLNNLLKIDLRFNEGLYIYALISLISGCIAAYYESRFLLNTKKPAS